MIEEEIPIDKSHADLSSHGGSLSHVIFSFSRDRMFHYSFYIMEITEST